jgi:tRNA threonylcarbamoyl adenosine modification protein YeaZ
VTTILGIDTASPTIALAVAVEGKIAASFAEGAAQDHSKVLLALIDRVLGTRRGDLAGIAVVKGPGNYAGLRVGIATAQGLAMACGAPLRGIGTLEAAALASRLDEVTAIHPAGRGEFAAQLFRGGQAAGPLGAAKADALMGLPLAGEGAGALGGIEIGPEERCRAALLALLPLFDSRTGESVDAVYLREPNITLPRQPNPALRLP